MDSKPRKTTPQPMPDQEILNIDGAAALLGVSVKTFSKVLRQGDVPGRKVGREWKFSRQALIDWIGGSRSGAYLESEAGEPLALPNSPLGGASNNPSVRRLRKDDFSVDSI